MDMVTTWRGRKVVLTVPAVQVQELKEHRVSEASTLGLAPGVWPEYVVLEGVAYNLVQVDAHGTRVYQEPFQGTTLKILND